MSDFGIVPEGFKPKTLRDCLSETEALQLSEISNELDVSVASPDGQRNAISARQAALVWELLLELWGILDPDNAEGVALVNVCKLTGTVPHDATYTLVRATVDVLAGTELLAGEVFANVNGKPDSRFTPVQDFTAPSSGAFTIAFRAEFAGPVPCGAGTLTQISVGPVTGTWNTVANAADGTLGEPADDEHTLRLRRVAELAAGGSSSVPALQTDISQAKNAAGDFLVSYVRVVDNDTSTTDADGRPRNSVECILVPSGTTVAGEVALFLFTAKGGGPTAFGLTSDTFTDTTGEVRVVHFTIPSSVQIWVKYSIKTTDDFAGVTDFQTNVAATLNAGARPGAVVAEIWDAQTAAKLPGVTNATVTQGLAVDPVGTVDITIGPRARASYDATRVQVVLL